ncbi:MAG: DUF5123 domain-containing protein [Bacteroidales bacterium]|nr:DUF5123 domain-containing protein [Bacteroidales bacterium]
MRKQLLMLFAFLLAAVQWAKADMDVKYVVTVTCVDEENNSTFTTEANVGELPWNSGDLANYVELVEPYYGAFVYKNSIEVDLKEGVSFNIDDKEIVVSDFFSGVATAKAEVDLEYNDGETWNDDKVERTFEFRIAKVNVYPVIKAIEDIKYNGIKPDDEVGANIGNTQEEYNKLSAEDKAAVYNYQDLLDEAAAYPVVKLIDVAGKGINGDGAAEKVAAARDEFDKLTPSQKTLTGDFANVLEEMEEYLVKLAIGNVDQLIAAIGEVVYTDECKGKIDAAKTAYDALTKAQQEEVQNYAALTAAESAYALLKDKAEFETYKGSKKTEAEALGTEDDSGAVAALITTAKQSIDGLAYDEAMTLDENKAEVDAIVTSLKSDIADQKAEEKLAADKAEFETYKGMKKTEAESLGKEGDSEAVAALITAAKQSIDAVVYNEAKSLDENKAEVDAILDKLAIDISDQRAADKITADKAAAADVDALIEAIGEVVYNNACKAKVSEARKAYDALKDDQQPYVSKLTVLEAAEAKLVELTPEPTDINIAPATGADIYTALVEATDGKVAKNISIELAKGGEYTISGSIEAPASIVINGNGATIDATALTGALTKLVNVAEPTEWTTVEQIAIKDVTIKSLKKALFASPCKNYLIENLEMNNVLAELAADATTIDFTKGSAAVKVSVENSTFWAATATGKSFYSSQSGQKVTEANGDLTQTFAFKHNTMYNLAKGKNFFSHRQSNQTWMTYDVEENIFVNCGKSGQTIKGMNQGASGANPTWTIKNNSFNFEGADTGKDEATGDDEEPVTGTIAGVVEFANVAEGDFTISVSQPQAKALIGDPRWIDVAVVNVMAKIDEIGEVAFTKECKAKIDDARKAYDALTEDQKATVENYETLTAAEARYAELTPEPEDIHIAPETGTDIYTALVAATEGKVVKDIYIELTEGGEYTISGSIEAPASIVITGNGATIDATTLEGAMTTLVTVENPTAWTTIEQIVIKDVTIKSLKKALFASPCKNYLIESFEIDNVYAELTADATTIDFTKGSAAVKVSVENSTFWAATATGKSFYSSQSGQKVTEANGDLTQTFAFKHNTMYNLAKGKNFFSHRQSNQAWMTYDVEENIFVNCGKNGQTIKGMNQGASGANPTWTIKNNIFNFEGADTGKNEETGDDEEPVTGTVAGVVAFTDVETGDFNGELTLGEGAETPILMPGDRRWTITVASGEVTAVKDVEVVESAKKGIYNLKGEKLAKPQRGLNIIDGKLILVK